MTSFFGLVNVRRGEARQAAAGGDETQVKWVSALVVVGGETDNSR